MLSLSPPPPPPPVRVHAPRTVCHTPFFSSIMDAQRPTPLDPVPPQRAQQRPSAGRGQVRSMVAAAGRLPRGVLAAAAETQTAAARHRRAKSPLHPLRAVAAARRRRHLRRTTRRQAIAAQATSHHQPRYRPTRRTPGGGAAAAASHRSYCPGRCCYLHRRRHQHHACCRRRSAAATHHLHWRHRRHWSVEGAPAVGAG